MSLKMTNRKLCRSRIVSHPASRISDQMFYALRWTMATLVLYFLLTLLIWMTAGYAEIPVTNLNSKPANMTVVENWAAATNSSQWIYPYCREAGFVSRLFENVLFH